MTEKEFMQEGINAKWLVLLFLRNIWIVVLATVVGAVVSGGGYFCKQVLWGPAKEYACLSRYYIEFANDKAKDYYNAYTWNDFMVSDPILGYTMTLLPSDMDKKFVQEAVVAKIESDVRVLATTVTTNDPKTSLLIAQATEQSLIHFAEELEEIKEIRVIKNAETELVTVNFYTVRMAMYGAVAGAIGAFLWLAFCITMDGSIYLPEHFEKRYPYPVLGMLTNEKQEKHRQELAANLSYLCKDGSFFLYPVGKQRKEELEEICTLCNELSSWKGRMKLATSGQEDEVCYEKLRATTGIVLAILYGNHDMALIDKTIEQLKRQNVNIAGAIIYGADSKMLKRYYRGE